MKAISSLARESSKLALIFAIIALIISFFCNHSGAITFVALAIDFLIISGILWLISFLLWKLGGK